MWDVGILRHVLENEVKNSNRALTVMITAKNFKNSPNDNIHFLNKTQNDSYREKSQMALKR